MDPNDIEPLEKIYKGGEWCTIWSYFRRGDRTCLDLQKFSKFSSGVLRWGTQKKLRKDASLTMQDFESYYGRWREQMTNDPERAFRSLQLGSNKVRIQMCYHQNEWKGIRAIQGHNAELVFDPELLQRQKVRWQDMPYLYHGTRRALVSRIATEGILAGGGDQTSHGGKRAKCRGDIAARHGHAPAKPSC